MYRTEQYWIETPFFSLTLKISLNLFSVPIIEFFFHDILQLSGFYIPGRLDWEWLMQATHQNFYICILMEKIHILKSKGAIVWRNSMNFTLLMSDEIQACESQAWLVWLWKEIKWMWLFKWITNTDNPGLVIKWMVFCILKWLGNGILKLLMANGHANNVELMPNASISAVLIHMR